MYGRWVGPVGVVVCALSLGACDEAGAEGTMESAMQDGGGAGAGEEAGAGEDAGMTGDGAGAEAEGGAGADAGADAEDAGASEDGGIEDGGGSSEDGAAQDGSTTGGLAEGKWGVTFMADGEPFEQLFDDPSESYSIYAIPITGVGDERFLELGVGAVTETGARLRMLPIGQTGTFHCGEGPNSFRIVEAIVRAGGSPYTANADQGSCTIVVTRADDVYEGTFSGSFEIDGEVMEVTQGVFRNDGTML